MLLSLPADFRALQSQVLLQSLYHLRSYDIDLHGFSSNLSNYNQTLQIEDCKCIEINAARFRAKSGSVSLIFADNEGYHGQHEKTQGITGSSFLARISHQILLQWLCRLMLYTTCFCQMESSFLKSL